MTLPYQPIILGSCSMDEMESILPTPRCSCDGCSCELTKKLTELKEKERTYEFLMGLDDQFSVIKTQILAMKPTPKLSTVYHLVAEDEQQRMITASKKPVREVAAFQASFQGRRDQTRNQQEKGWMKTEKGTVSTKPCSYCGKEGTIEMDASRELVTPNGGQAKEKEINQNQGQPWWRQNRV